MRSEERSSPTVFFNQSLQIDFAATAPISMAAPISSDISSLPRRINQMASCPASVSHMILVYMLVLYMKSKRGIKREIEGEGVLREHLFPLPLTSIAKAGGN